MNNFEFGKDREEKINKFLDNLAWYFHSKPAMDLTARATEKLNDKLQELRKTVEGASESSKDLAKALNRLTFWGVVVAGLGVLVALGKFILEIVKYVNG